MTVSHSEGILNGFFRRAGAAVAAEHAARWITAPKYMNEPQAPSRPDRRQWLQLAALAASGVSPAQAAAQPSLRLAQIVDVSAQQQELSRDYGTGLQLAWTDTRDRRGPGASVAIVRFDSDGSDAAIADAIGRIKADRSIIGLVGSVGDGLAINVCAQAAAAGLAIAHIAPWMADTRHDADDGVICLFPSRESQFRHAMQLFQGMGVSRIQAVFTSERDLSLFRTEVESLARTLSLRVDLFSPRAGEDIRALAGRLAGTNGVALYLGTSLELSLLTQAMAARGDRRFVVGLGDSDYSVLRSLGIGVGVPLVLAQVVPNPQTSKVEVVGRYRTLLKKLFDEAPSPMSLAGFLAGQYAARLLRDIAGPVSRESLLAQARRRPAHDLDGFRIDFQGGRRGSSYVDHRMLKADGQLVG
jgi:ABC-type branched-subunit amino acid transport system substrate-binding protein